MFKVNKKHTLANWHHSIVFRVTFEQTEPMEIVIILKLCALTTCWVQLLELLLILNSAWVNKLFSIRWTVWYIQKTSTRKICTDFRLLTKKRTARTINPTLVKDFYKGQTKRKNEIGGSGSGLGVNKYNAQYSSH